jgi:hypothetical protein
MEVEHLYMEILEFEFETPRVRIGPSLAVILLRGEL